MGVSLSVSLLDPPPGHWWWMNESISFSVFLRLCACGLCGLSHSVEPCGDIFLAMGAVESGPTQNRWQTQAIREEGCFPLGKETKSDYGVWKGERNQEKRQMTIFVCVCVSEIISISLNENINRPFCPTKHTRSKRTTYANENKNNANYTNCFPVSYIFSTTSCFNPY